MVRNTIFSNYQPDQMSDDFLRLETRFFTRLEALRTVFRIPPLRVLRFRFLVVVFLFGFFFWLRALFIFAPQALAAFDPFFK